MAATQRRCHPDRAASTFGAGQLPIDSGLGNRDDELTAPLADARHLSHDLVLKIPRQDQHVVGPRLAYLLRRTDGDMGPRQKLALLVGVTVHGVSQEIRPDAAVVQQSVALAWSSVADDGAALPFGLNQELEQPTFGLLYSLLECGVVVQA